MVSAVLTMGLASEGGDSGTGRVVAFLNIQLIPQFCIVPKTLRRSEWNMTIVEIFWQQNAVTEGVPLEQPVLVCVRSSPLSTDQDTL